MDPVVFLMIVAGVTAAAVLVNAIVRRVRSGKLKGLAAEWGMHYSARDRFHLADRIAPRIPCAGAADVRVIDLIYGLQRERFRYVFTAEYTEGVVRTKHRRRRVVAMTEPKDRGMRDEVIADLGVAPEDLP